MFKLESKSALRLLGTLFALAAAVPVYAQADPAAVQQKLFSALDAGDVPAALALFTDDAVIDSESGDCAKAPCVGRVAIQKDLERFVRDKSRRVTTLETHASGNVLVTRFEARSAKIQGTGIDRIILWGIREMRGDKIASSRCCLPERTDPQTARFLDWEYAQSSNMGDK